MRDKGVHPSWMNDDQQECHEMLADLFRGYHHINGKVKPAGGTGIEHNTVVTNHFATYDFDFLTTAVLMAHDRAIRFEVTPSGPRMLRFFLHKRQRDGLMHERHPTIQDAIKTHNERFKCSDNQ